MTLTLSKLRWNATTFWQNNKNYDIQRFHSDGKTWKTWKMGRHFPVREKSGNFEQTGKVRENHTKYWKTEIN